MLHRKLATIYDGWLFFVFEVPGFNLVQADSDGDSGKTREGRICVHDLWCCNNVRSVIKCGVRPLIFQENLNLFCCAIYTRTQTGNASRVALNQRPPLDFVTWPRTVCSEQQQKLYPGQVFRLHWCDLWLPATIPTLTTKKHPFIYLLWDSKGLVSRRHKDRLHPK